MTTRLQSSLPAQHREALGHVAANFALLEHHLTGAAGGLIGDEDRDLCNIITAELSFKQLVALVSSLVQYRVKDESQKQDVTEQLSLALKVEDRRNQVMHSVWLLVGDPGSTTVARLKITAKHKRGLKRHVEQMTVADIEAVADEIGEAAQGLLDALGRLPADTFPARERRAMRTVKLTMLGFGLNAALDAGKTLDIERVRKEIDAGTILDSLKAQLGSDVDLSAWDEADRAEVIDEWQRIDNAMDAWRKAGVRNNGICLLQAFVLDGIQQRVLKG